MNGSNDLKALLVRNSESHRTKINGHANDLESMTPWLFSILMQHPKIIPKQEKASLLLGHKSIVWGVKDKLRVHLIGEDIICNIAYITLLSSSDSKVIMYIQQIPQNQISPFALTTPTQLVRDNARPRRSC